MEGLKLFDSARIKEYAKRFTFHCGGIKTASRGEFSLATFPLHSTVEGLKRILSPSSSYRSTYFTFHYGGIKTDMIIDVRARGLALHSTMEGLKHTTYARLVIDDDLYIPLWRD